MKKHIVTVSFIQSGILDETAVIIAEDDKQASLEAEKLVLKWAKEKLNFTDEDIEEWEYELLSGDFTSGCGKKYLFIHHPQTVINTGAK